MVGLPSGTVTFLFTVLEGSTRRWDDDADAMRAAVARHDALLERWAARAHLRLGSRSRRGVLRGR